MKPALLALALALLAPAALAQQAPQQDWMVHMERTEDGWRYVPDTITLVPGGLVQLMVFGPGQFSLTLDGMPDYDADIASGEGTVRTSEFAAPATPGRYPFRDKYHPETTGLLVVQGTAGPARIGVVPGGYEARFAPDRLVVEPGQQVVFRANGTFGHNLQATDGSFTAGDLSPGQEGSFVAPSAPGEYPFECRFHKEQGMVGTLVVRAASAGDAPVAGEDPTTTDPTPSSRSETPGLPIPLLVSLLLILALAARRRSP